MKVSEVMNKGMVAVDTDTSLTIAGEVMRGSGIGSVLVRKNGTIHGILTERDIVTKAVAKGHNPRTIKVGQIMTPQMITCYEDQNVDDALTIMNEQQIHHIIVLDRDNTIVGIISATDILMRAQIAQPVGAGR